MMWCIRRFHVTALKWALVKCSLQSVVSISTRVMDDRHKDFQQHNVACKRWSHLGDTSQPQCWVCFPLARTVGTWTWQGWIDHLKYELYMFEVVPEVSRSCGPKRALRAYFDNVGSTGRSGRCGQKNVYCKCGNIKHGCTSGTETSTQT